MEGLCFLTLCACARFCVPIAARRFHSGRAPLQHCMQANTPLHITTFLLLFLLCAERTRSFVLHPSKTIKTPHGKGTYTYSTAASAPRQASLSFAGTSLVDRAPSLRAAADATTVMTSEADMPVLRVIRVDEVPTLKADPVDPIAREQAKVRSPASSIRSRIHGVAPREQKRDRAKASERQRERHPDRQREGETDIDRERGKIRVERES